MEIEKIDRVCVAVNDADEAVKFFSKLLGTTFTDMPELCAKAGVERKKTITEHADPVKEAGWDKTRVLVSPIGLEILQLPTPVEKEGVRSFHFKVTNMEKAKAEMKEKGIRLLAECTMGGLKEAIYSADDLHGCRIVLVEYNAPSVVEAELQK